jgi:hypothetical protein
MRVVYSLTVLMLIASTVCAVSAPKTHNGRTFYIVTSTDSTEDSGSEVCTKLGKTCVGYMEPSSAVCKLFHPGAAETSSLSGDQSGVYCNGPPQSGVCSSQSNTCHTCPQCTLTVSCPQSIGGLYREMYVQCADRGCTITLTATNVAEFFNQIPSLNAQLTGCPQKLPSMSGFLIADGATVVDVKMNSGATRSFTFTKMNGLVNGVRAGSGPCKQRITLTENDFNTALNAASVGQAVAYLVGQGRIKITGCSILPKIRLAIASPIVKIVSGWQVPQPPKPKPPPNCGKVGEQCNNRACWSGICAAPNENVNGQWRFVNYRCLAQSDWASRCEGRGNTPAPWHCLTGPCR